MAPFIYFLTLQSSKVMYRFLNISITTFSRQSFIFIRIEFLENYLWTYRKLHCVHNKLLFNTFQQSWQRFVHSACLSPVPVNILRMCRDLWMLYRFPTAYLAKWCLCDFDQCKGRQERIILYSGVLAETF